MTTNETSQETDPIIAAFLASGNYASVDAWMADSDFVKADDGDWYKADHARFDPDDDQPYNPEDVIAGAIESSVPELNPVSEHQGGSVLVVEGITGRHGVGYVGPESSGRQVHGGPIVPGPWAYAYGLATVIALQAITNNADVHNVSIGDLVMIDGHYFVIVGCRRCGRGPCKNHVQLDLVQ